MKMIVCGLLMFLTLPATASAHGLSMRIDLVGPAVAVTVTFDDDEPADDCIITVTAGDGTVVAKGPTNKTGLFSFPRPGPGTYTVTSDAGAGHLAKKTLAVAAAGDAMPAEPGAPRRSRNVAVGATLVAIGIIVWMVVLRKRKGAKAA